MADDYTASTTTTGRVTVGGSMGGVIETTNDNDWFAVSLTAGQTYQFRLDSNSNTSAGLSDPFLSLLSSSGSKIGSKGVSDNNSGSGGISNGNALISYTAPTSGTYYLAASDASSGTGGYTVSATPVTSPTLSIVAPFGGSKSEGNSATTPYDFTVERAGNTTGTSSAVWAVTGSSANAADFVGSVLPSGSVTFAAGQTTANVTVNVQGDRAIEQDESFTVTLSNPIGTLIQSGSTSISATILDDDGTTKAKVYMGANDTFTVSDRGATLIGSLGINSVKIASGATGIKTDANFSRIELGGNLADYRFEVRSGTGLLIQNQPFVTVDTLVSLNTDVTLAFANGSATLAQTGIAAFTLGGQTISTTASETMSVALNAADKSSFSTATFSFVTKAKVYMGANDTFTVNDSGATLIGSLGSNTVKISPGVTGVTTDANFSRIELGGNLADYKLGVIAGTGLQLQNAAGVAVDTLVSLNTDVTLAFANGSATLAQTGITAFTLGGQTISTTTPATMSVALNSADKSSFGTAAGASTVSVSAAGTSDASTGNISFNVHPTASFTYNDVAGFAAGDKLVFDAGSAISVTNTSGTDGIVDVTGSLAGQSVVVHLTGIAAASDTPVSITTFNTVFGAGSLA